MASVGQSDDVPFDLTILFFDDAFQWCEYLFDLFQAYDLTQNSERINDFPTNEVTLSNIKRSLVQLVIISPQCVESCSTMIEQVTMSTIGLVCGTNDEDIEMLYQRIPSSRSWKLVDTSPKTIVSETMNMIRQDAIEETYVDMIRTPLELRDDQADLYLPMDEIVGSDQRDLYEQMTGASLVDTEETYEAMVPSCTAIQSYGEKVRIIPRTARCGRSELVVLLFDDSSSIEGKDNFTVEFGTGSKKTVVPAIKVNSYTLSFETPKDQPAGRAQVIIRSNKQDISQTQFTLESSMDVLANILMECVNPIEFLCETLKISPVDHVKLDSYLSNMSKQIIETDKFREVFGTGLSTEGESDKEYPTILHFAAKYGLSDLCVAMMNMPCVVQALNLSNCDGKTPPDLAEESGFSELKAVLKSYQDNDIYAPITTEGPGAYVEMDRRKGKTSYGNSGTTQTNKIRYVKPFQVPIPAYRVEEVLQGTPEDIYGLYDTLPSPTKLPPVPPVQTMKNEPVPPTAPIETPCIQKKNEENEEDSRDSGLDPGQLELIDLQKRVARKEITVDEAVKIFENFPSFTVARPLVIDLQTLKNEKKKKSGKKGSFRKLRSRSQSSPMMIDSSRILPIRGSTFSYSNERPMKIGSTQMLPNRASPVNTKAKRSHSVNIISPPSNFQVLSEPSLDNLNPTHLSKPKDTQKERAMSCVESLRTRADDVSPKLPVGLTYDALPVSESKTDFGSRPSSIASSHSRGSTCSRDSSIFEEEDVDSRYRTMRIPLPAIPCEAEVWEGDERMALRLHREPPATPFRGTLPSDLPERFPPPPPRPNRPTPAPRKTKPTD